MARDDGMKYGAGGTLIQEIVEPQPKKTPSVRKGIRNNKAEMLEETVRDALPSDVEPQMEEDSDEKF
jgi:hypothetical protein